jgi:hypothetical protein
MVPGHGNDRLGGRARVERQFEGHDLSCASGGTLTFEQDHLAAPGTSRRHPGSRPGGRFLPPPPPAKAAALSPRAPFVNAAHDFFAITGPGTRNPGSVGCECRTATQARRGAVLRNLAWSLGEALRRVAEEGEP